MLLRPTSAAVERPTGSTERAQSGSDSGAGRSCACAGHRSSAATTAHCAPNWMPVISSGAGKWPRPRPSRCLLKRLRQTESEYQAQIRAPTRSRAALSSRVAGGAAEGRKRLREAKARRARWMRTAALPSETGRQGLFPEESRGDTHVRLCVRLASRKTRTRRWMRRAEARLRASTSSGAGTRQGAGCSPAASSGVPSRREGISGDSEAP